MSTLQLTRLDLEAFSEAARKHVDPASPPPMRMMAAKSMVPLPPNEMVTVLYQLSYDPETKVREAATQSLRELPSDIMSGVVRAPLDVRVLDVLARNLLTNDALLELLVVNQAVADDTIAFLASKVSERIAEVIAGLHVRLLRAAPIIEGLYTNPRTRMSTVQKILDLARRNNVVLANLPGLQEAMMTPDYDKDSDNDISDEEFASVLVSSVERENRDDDEERIEALLSGEEEAKTEEDQRRMSRWQLIERMNPAQKIRLALIGSNEDRAILLRDSRKVVHIAAIRSPKITPGEAAKYASSRNIPDGVISYISKNREWTRFYPVTLALVSNPKCPLSDSVGFLKSLRPNDLKNLQRNKNIPSQLARQAQMLFRQKSAGQGGKG